MDGSADIHAQLNGFHIRSHEIRRGFAPIPFRNNLRNRIDTEISTHEGLKPANPLWRGQIAKVDRYGKVTEFLLGGVSLTMYMVILKTRLQIQRAIRP